MAQDVLIALVLPLGAYVAIVLQRLWEPSIRLAGFFLGGGVIFSVLAVSRILGAGDSFTAVLLRDDLTWDSILRMGGIMLVLFGACVFVHLAIRNWWIRP